MRDPLGGEGVKSLGGKFFYISCFYSVAYLVSFAKFHALVSDVQLRLCVSVAMKQNKFERFNNSKDQN